MKCILLVAGHTTRLEAEIAAAARTSDEFASMLNTPKSLLRGPSQKQLLTNWWEAISQTRDLFTSCLLVVNAEKYKYYERWATANNFPRENIINDGTTSATGGLGAIADFELALRSRDIDEDVMVVAGDMLFHPERFDIGGVVRFFQSKDGQLNCYYQMRDTESCERRGIIEVDHESSRIVNMWEKPAEGTVESRLASIVFYCFQRSTFPLLREYLRKHHDNPQMLGFGTYMTWLLTKTTVYGMKLPDHFSLIGDIGLAEYKRCLQDAVPASPRRELPVTHKANARVGLMGNPSDGFFGKTISLSIANYWAQVSIKESARLVLLPHPLNDPNEFGSLADLHGISRQEGYLGGLRLMQATCKRFFEYCRDHGIALDRRNFTMSYDTNIPRQVGLAGSSAIVTSALRCLMSFYKLTDSDIPKTLQPNFVLSVERDELGINAGLQDRVVQIYGGLVYMDFSRELMDAKGHGEYVQLDASKLPALWLAYLADPSDSGRIHSNVRQRFDNGEEEVHAAMREFASYTVDARKAIEAGDHAALADLMDKNFSLRHRIYGEASLGEANMQMVNIARKHNAAVKFPGSGGAVVGLCRDPAKLTDLKEELEANGFVFVRIKPADNATAAATSV